MQDKTNVLVVTMSTSYNYGAVLQAYAFQAFLKKQGRVSVKFLDQRPVTLINQKKLFVMERALEELQGTY